MKRKIILPSFVAIAILTLVILSANSVSAQNSVDGRTIVQRLAQRFNLNEEEVEDVFDEERDERRAERYAQLAERLNDLVTEGKLTEDQKEKILEKHEEIQDKMESLEGPKTDEQRVEMRALHEEMRTFMESLGVSEGLVGPMGGEFGVRGHGLKDGFGMGAGAN